MAYIPFRRFDVLVCLGCIALLSSFAWYATKGPRGYAYKAELELAHVALLTDTATLAAERSALEKQVRLMRPERVDRDMLEQLARSELKLALPNEVTVKLSD